MKKLALLAALAAAALAAWLWLPVERLPELIERAREHGWRGAVLLGLCYAAAAVLMIPGSLLTLAIGFLYGPWWGTALASPAGLLGATLAFLLGRGLLRGAVESKMSGNRRFQALAGAMEKNGFKILLLLRLSPLFPYTLLNYAFGLTRIRLSHYLLGSFLGMLPGAFLYVYLGSTAGDLSQLLDGGPAAGGAGTAFKLLGLALTLAVTLYVARLARKALAEAAACS